MYSCGIRLPAGDPLIESAVQCQLGMSANRIIIADFLLIQLLNWPPVHLRSASLLADANENSSMIVLALDLGAKLGCR